MRVAVADLGTNSTRLLIADVSPAGGLATLESRSVVTRMGDRVDGDGVIGEAAIGRVLDVLGQYRALIDGHGAERAVALLTSAGRDAANGPGLVARASAVLGCATRIISGEEEARLVYRGATIGRDPEAETAVLDVGGGSTELAIGHRGRVSYHSSSQVGVVRQSERHLHHDPPGPDEIAALRADVHGQLATLAAGRRAAMTVSVGGTPISCATMLGHPDAHGTRVTAAECERLLVQVTGASQAQLRAMQGLHPARAPAIVAGISIHLEAMSVLGAGSFEVSENDLRHGAALELADF